MKKPIVFVIIIISLAIVATYYPWQQEQVAEIVTENEKIPEAGEFLKIPEVNEKTDIKYPVPEVDSEPTEVVNVDEKPAYESVENPVVPEAIVVQPVKPLPLLDESDNAITAAIKKVTAGGLFSYKSFIRHFVVTLDNMTNQKLPQRYIFTQRVPDKFAVITQEVDTALLDSKNFKRYSGFVNMAEKIDMRKLAIQYVRFYPLFQEAYEELGYPDRYFNDRFIQVIDHLLAAPEIKGTIDLVRPKVFYNFARPELEALSAGQKILVRIGFDNAQRVKAKLRELRSILTTLPPQ